MINCPNCGASVAPTSRFCTECGRPMPAGQAPAPPMQPGMRPPMPPGQPGMMPPAPMSQPMGVPMQPPAPPMQPVMRPPMPPGQPGMMPPAPPMPFSGIPPVAPAVQAAAAAAAPVVAPAPAPVAAPVADRIRMATAGDLFNNSDPLSVIVTEQKIVLMMNGGAARVEEIPGVRHAVIGDFDGDGTQDLVLINDTHVWVLRMSPTGSIPSGKVALSHVPEHLTVAPFTRDGQAVLMETTAEKITFYVLHPAKGLVEVGATTVPAFEP
jgi:hypothetical protein